MHLISYSNFRVVQGVNHRMAVKLKKADKKQDLNDIKNGKANYSNVPSRGMVVVVGGGGFLKK